MHNFGNQSFRLATAMIAVAISTSPAYAYLDPGTGSIILQVLLGGIAGLVLAVKLYWHKLLSLSGMRRQQLQGGREGSVKVDERRRPQG